MNQHEQILEFLQSHDYRTKLDGFVFGCTKVDTRISELRRAGYGIGDRWVTTPAGKRYKQYFLEDDA